ncbi:IS3 family transposase, partial [Streptococcus sp. CSL10205-OR2]|nr:IS3 family transposase [Streptococcus sp. CSL10205-OR2]
MKLSDDDKLEIYTLRSNGRSWSQISEAYDVNLASLKYLVKLMDRYGVESVRKRKNSYY